MNTHDDDNTDPTGMRALLRGLPDPGPMPDDLVARIRASLAELSPLDVHAGSDEAADRVSRGTAARPSPWWARNASKAAIAAVVLIGGGALVSGPLGLSGASDDAGGDMSTAADASGEKAETLSGISPEASAATPDADGPTDTTTPPSSARGGAATLGAVVVRHSGRDYSTTGLADQIGPKATGAATTPLTAESPGIGPIGTEIGVRSCLGALGLPRASAADVDLGTLDKTPAAVLVVTLGGERTAYAVGRDCTTGHPALLTGPVTLP